MADKISPVPLKNVTIAGGFWGLRAETNRTVTLAIEYDQLKKTGRIDAFRLDWEGALFEHLPHRRRAAEPLAQSARLARAVLRRTPDGGRRRLL